MQGVRQGPATRIECWYGRAEDCEDAVECIAVRLVTPEGDVVWSTTQESRGAKYKSATADVADKIVKELARELERLGKANGAN